VQLPKPRNSTKHDLTTQRVTSQCPTTLIHLSFTKKNPSYELAPGTIVGGSNTKERNKRASSSDLDTAPPPPLLDITAEIAAAAALVAEADAAANSTTSILVEKRADFWMENIARKGRALGAAIQVTRFSEMSRQIMALRVIGKL
jgi:hypothetical protein